MGMKMPGSLSGTFDPKVVESLIEVEKLPVEAAKKRKETVVQEREEFAKLDKLVTDLDASLNGLKSRASFYKLKVESSHPDILDGVITGPTLTGSYEFEIRGPGSKTVR